MKSVLFAVFLAVPAIMGYETTELTDDSWDAEIGAMDTALGKSQLKTQDLNCIILLIPSFALLIHMFKRICCNIICLELH